MKEHTVEELKEIRHGLEGCFGSGFDIEASRVGLNREKGEFDWDFKKRIQAKIDDLIDDLEKQTVKEEVI